MARVGSLRNAMKKYCVYLTRRIEDVIEIFSCFKVDIFLLKINCLTDIMFFFLQYPSNFI